MHYSLSNACYMPAHLTILDFMVRRINHEALYDTDLCILL